MCCVVLCRAIALFLFRLADVSLFRSGFIAGPLLCLFRESPHSLVCVLPLAGIWWAPAIAPSRDLATPHPFVSYVVCLLAQSDMPVRWEDVHISSIGSTYYTHPLYTPTYSCYSPATMAAEKRCSKSRKIQIFQNPRCATLDFLLRAPS